ncbi:hypothetical protein [Mariprofundus ferrooxydans]|uniref:Uncharacterized protein n=1 Tax=Mariprofundus ferrooxydans PV-1 TaxID=314345 RepID=Q0F1R9_9PROT|nr:hypothetical protein [Mariprofundus ferrooxydans]EAU55831.1 hypothetical protein SPV1_02747 [Mariprofundus ferrooxydans PV-1]KON47024.1 hypothetical protein AL013_10565 [Mariprofundus ferrooxydans]
MSDAELSELSVADVLPIGICIEGVRYRKFRLRAGTLRDSIRAAEALAEEGIDTTEATSNQLRYATIAQKLDIENLGRQLTLDEMLDMSDRDTLIIEKADDEIEKKLDALSESLPQSA